MPEPDPLPTPAPAATSRPSRARWLGLLLVLPVAGAGLGLLAAAIGGLGGPRAYESVAIMEVHPSAPAGIPVGGGEGGRAGGSPGGARFIDTQVGIIRAPETLRWVVERLDLAARWSDLPAEAVLEVLLASVAVEALPGTDLVKIRVRSASPIDARDIAVAVMDAYKERRASIERERARVSLEALETEVRAQEDLVEEKRKLMYTIIRVVGVPDSGRSGEAGSGGAFEQELLREAQREAARLATEKRRWEVRLENVQALSNEELAAHPAAGDWAPEVQALAGQLAERTGALERKRAALGGGHPEVAGVKIEIDALKARLEKAVEGFRESLPIAVREVDRQLEAQAAIVAERKEVALNRALELEDLQEAQADYDAARRFLEELTRRNRLRRIALKMPTSPITVHAEPREALRPSILQADRILWKGARYGSIGGFLVALPIVGLLVMRR